MHAALKFRPKAFSQLGGLASLRVTFAWICLNLSDSKCKANETLALHTINSHYVLIDTFIFRVGKSKMHPVPIPVLIRKGLILQWIFSLLSRH